MAQQHWPAQVGKGLMMQRACCAIQVESAPRKDPLDALLAGEVRSVEYSGGQVFVDAPRPGRVYLSGSFNPLHEGARHLPPASATLSDIPSVPITCMIACQP